MTDQAGNTQRLLLPFLANHHPESLFPAKKLSWLSKSGIYQEFQLTLVSQVASAQLGGLTSLGQAVTNGL